MYLSYYKRPELMLLDKGVCEEFKTEKHIWMFFDNLLYTQVRAYFGGEKGAVDTRTERDMVRDILVGWIRSDYFTERPIATYYISKTFYEALRKTYDKITPLFSEDGMLEKIHEDCCLIWNDTTYLMWKDPYGDNSYYMLAICNGSVVFFSNYSFGKDRIEASHSLSCMYLDDYGDDDCLFIESIYSFLLFKKYGNVDIEIVARNKTVKKSQILGEKINNFMGIDVQVLDSRWFTTICRDEGFMVSGHFRLQNYINSKGQWDKKLIYIYPYTKKGYHRLAPIVNIK